MARYREMELEDYLLILKRSKWLLVIPCVLVGLAVFGFSLLLPDQYRSETLILVERQQVPKEYVKPTVTTGLQDRLQSMTQEILSRTRLRYIIDKFGLYRRYSEQQLSYRLGALAAKGLKKAGVENYSMFGRYLGEPSLEDLIATMRSNIQVELVRHRRSEVTAFKVSYAGESPQLVQQVATELASLFIEENLKVRERMAENTSKFIGVELESARRELESQEAKLRQFKTRYMGQLPEQERTNIELFRHWQAQLQANTASLNRLQQEDLLLRNSLSLRETMVGVHAGTEVRSGSPISLQRRLSDLRFALTGMEARYTPQHPDVVKLKREIIQLQTRLSEAAQEPEEKAPEPSIAPPLDPAIAGIEARLEVNQMVHETLLRDQKKIQLNIKQYRERITLMPLREQQYVEITRDYGVAQKNYESLLHKRALSSLASNLEKRQQGEQFRVLDPANLPTKPFRPNRPLVAFLGSAVGLMLGLGWVAAGVFLDKSLRNERDVEFYLEAPVLALIPSVDSPAQKRSFMPWIARRRNGADARTSSARA